nr:unnamed protein product [Callosobruchus chinensis]
MDETGVTVVQKKCPKVYGPKGAKNTNIDADERTTGNSRREKKNFCSKKNNKKGSSMKQNKSGKRKKQLSETSSESDVSNHVCDDEEIDDFDIFDNSAPMEETSEFLAKTGLETLSMNLTFLPIDGVVEVGSNGASIYSCN